MYPQDFLAKLVKDVRGEASVCAEHLSFEHVTHPQILLGHEAYVLPVRVHDHVFVGLLEPEHDIHELQLSRHHDSRVFQDVGGWMALVEDAIRILGYVDWREEIVVLWIGIM